MIEGVLANVASLGRVLTYAEAMLADQVAAFAGPATEASSRHTTTIGQGQAPLTENLLFLLLGVLIGGLIKVAVDQLLLCFRRRAVSRALLAEIRACCVSAECLGHWFAEHVLPEGVMGVLRKQYLHTIDKPLWDGAVKDLGQLPPRHLDRLVTFYAFAESINRKVSAFQEEQQRLERVGGLEKPDVDMGASITQALLQIGSTTVGMCEELVKCESVKRLRDLPDSYKKIYPVAPVLVTDSGQCATGASSDAREMRKE